LAELGTALCIPSVVVSELLAGVDPSKHAKLLADFDKRFFCPPFDVRSAGLAARLWQFERGLPGASSGLPKDQRSDRRVLKSDILIVATAKAAGATTFYSHEEKCRRLAKQAGMKPEDLPLSPGELWPDVEGDKKEKQ
jgi:predicted nucleic acid-binding protein